jgi:hypothetical protein
MENPAAGSIGQLLEARFADEIGMTASISRVSDGSWSEAQALDAVNTDVTELAASLSPDLAHQFGGAVSSFVCRLIPQATG